MTRELPPARVRNAPLLEHTHRLRRFVPWLLGLAAVAVGIWWLRRPERSERYQSARKEGTAAAWIDYARYGGDADAARAELSKLHDAARRHLRDAGATRPEALDPLLAILRQELDHRVALTA